MNRIVLTYISMALGIGLVCKNSVPPLWNTRPDASVPTVNIEKLPNGAVQPQAVTDTLGVVHLVYFLGNPEAGDLFYTHYKATDGISTSTPPIRVNSEPNTAMAMGTIRTEQIALGGKGDLHVVWNGLSPKNGKQYSSMYLAYTHLNSSHTAFQPQQNLCKWTGNLDGGSSVAADLAGNVYAFWHTAPPDVKIGEAGRGVFMAVSHDGGNIFSREKMINPDPTGACACCSMRAMVDGSEILKILYRAARNNGTERDTMLLVSSDHGSTFKMRSLDPWPLNACPMSSMSMTTNGSLTDAAWETKERVFWAPLDGEGKPTIRPIVAPEVEKSKHPVIISNGKGQVLFAWTEGTGWNRGGSFSWQVYDQIGNSVGRRGHSDGVPVWSLLSAYAKPDGGFVIVH